MLPRRARDAKVRLQMQRTLSGRHPGSGNQFGTIDHFGLGENIAQVRFYRRERDIQLAGNQLIAGAFAHHADDFPLFRRQDGGQIIFFLQAVADGQLYQRSTAWARWRSSLEKGTSRISEIPATIRRSRRIKISVMSRTLFGNINS